MQHNKSFFFFYDIELEQLGYYYSVDRDVLRQKWLRLFMEGRWEIQGFQVRGKLMNDDRINEKWKSKWEIIQINQSGGSRRPSLFSFTL